MSFPISAFPLTFFQRFSPFSVLYEEDLGFPPNIPNKLSYRGYPIHFLPPPPPNCKCLVLLQLMSCKFSLRISFPLSSPHFPHSLSCIETRRGAAIRKPDGPKFGAAFCMSSTGPRLVVLFLFNVMEAYTGIMIHHPRCHLETVMLQGLKNAETRGADISSYRPAIGSLEAG